MRRLDEARAVTDGGLVSRQPIGDVLPPTPGAVTLTRLSHAWKATAGSPGVPRGTRPHHGEADFWQVAEILYDPDGAAARVRDHAAEMLADGKPPMDEGWRAWSRWASEDRLDAAAGLAADDSAAARMVLHERVIDLTATFFDLRGQWTPPTKRRPARIA